MCPSLIVSRFQKESSLAGGRCIESRKKPFLQIFTFVVVPGRGRTHSGLPPR
jgi:hypothetical protein